MNMRMRLIVSLFCFFNLSSVFADPISIQTTQDSASIITTNTYQLLMPQKGGRKGCSIQNRGNNIMYVFPADIGGGPPADTLKSFKLNPDGVFNCNTQNGDTVIYNAIYITGTAGDLVVFGVQ